MNNFWQIAFMLMIVLVTFKKVLKLKYGTCVGWYPERVIKIAERGDKIIWYFLLLMIEIGFLIYMISEEIK